MRYTANPVQVVAYAIVQIGESQADGSLPLKLDTGEWVVASAPMLARYFPSLGDYWVIQEDSYIYLNPKAVFIRKYSPLPVTSFGIPGEPNRALCDAPTGQQAA